MVMANDNLSRFVVASAALHAVLFAVVVLAPSLLTKKPSAGWGTNVSGIKVGVTNRLPGIPLPSPPDVQENAKGNDSKTINPADVTPKPREKAPTEAEVKIPTGKKKPEPKNTAPTKTARGKPESEPTTASNAIPGAAGGQVALPYGDLAASGSGTVTFGEGSFGTRFPEYVSSLIRAIHQQWQKPAGIPYGAKVYVTFTIPKGGGQVSNVDVEKTSGLPPMDNSAKRAVMTASVPPLPREYSGSSIDVRFYFENSR
jgi:outer membrane biosynthesis protein TonB